MQLNLNFDATEGDKLFTARFRHLTGSLPMSWQSRLFRDFFSTGDLSQLSVIDLPTGLGKTMVMAIWLIAREINPHLPRRLVYVVDRRTVVDQATDLALKLRARSISGSFEVSTLRGQLADNREWCRDLSTPAIIVGTVDLIGSALLFSGYRSSFKRRPLEAGLLGQDSLLLLDEAHLCKPFDKLVHSISTFQSGRGLPLKVVKMSATNEQQKADVSFKLQFDQFGNLTGSDAQDTKITERWNAKKTLTITTLGEKENLKDRLALAAIKIAKDESSIGKRIVVFVRRPDDARAIAETIRNYGITKLKPGPYVDSVEILTGTMRGLERDELVKKSVFTERWLNGELEPADEFNASPVFLISTSAGEVGLDLNADHMICDAAPIDSMIQRLGRVNRRGKGDATAQLYFVPPKKTKDSAAKKLVGVDLSIVNTIHLLTGVTDVSPRSIATLKNSDSWKINYAAACSPEPGILELTDILLDAWSMTSIVSPIPGRPEVAQWIRGVAEELPQTTIAWRAELDLTGFDRLDIEDIEEWFDTHRVLTHEVLRVPSYVATQWLTDRWSKLAPEKKLEIGQRSLVLDRAGMQVLRVSDLLEQLTSKSSDATSAILNTDLILPASFGGIERGKGLLDANAPESSLSEEKCNASSDVADNGDRCRQVITKFEDSAPVIDALGAGVKPPKAARLVLDIQFDELKRVKLVSLVPKKEKLEFGSQRQTLSHHVDLVRKHMDAILSRLHLSDEIKLAAELAANFHDHGKNRERWQRIVNGVATPAGQPWSDTTIGKAGDEMKRDPHGYRHEFGSLCEFAEAFKKSALQDSYGNPVNQDVADLAMHLIATHHGRGRPYFPKGGFDPHAEGQVTSIHSELIRRFALLQIKFGWWQLAWLENLLRCADALASSELAVGIYEATEGRSEE